MKQILHEVKENANKIRGIEQDCKNRSDKLTNTIRYASTKVKELDDELNGFKKKAQEFYTNTKEGIDSLTNRIPKNLEEKIHQMNMRVHTLYERMEVQEKSDKLTASLDINTIKQLTMDLKKIHEQHKRRITRLQQSKEEVFEALEEKATQLFHEMKESTKTFITKQIRRSTNTHTTRRKLFPLSSDSSASDTNKKGTYGRRPNRSHYPFSDPDVRNQGIKSDPDMVHGSWTPDTNKINPDYIRKNVKVKCTQDSQILDFYTKLRIALQKGGIYLIPLVNVTKEDSLADLDMGRDTAHINDQSNALYTVLSNEDVIPQEYTMAQNCIMSCATTMDGFKALKKILTRVHPILTQKKPPEKAPTYSDFDDIHMYEQGLRNHFQLQYLYNGFTYSEMQKSKQFLQGMDTTVHDDAVRRMTSILDTVETQKLRVNEEHTIDNLASTISNMTNESEGTVSVNVMRWGGPQNRGNRNFRPRLQQSNYGRRHAEHNNTQQRNQRMNPSNQRFTKTQCHACQTFGHKVNDCRLLPKVLAIMRFAAKEKATCDKILQKYTSFNSVSNKTAMVHALRDMGAWGDDEDIESMYQDESIINSMFINMDDEWTAATDE